MLPRVAGVLVWAPWERAAQPVAAAIAVKDTPSDDKMMVKGDAEVEQPFSTLILHDYVGPPSPSSAASSVKLVMRGSGWLYSSIVFRTHIDVQ